MPYATEVTVFDDDGKVVDEYIVGPFATLKDAEKFVERRFPDLDTTPDFSVSTLQFLAPNEARKSKDANAHARRKGL